MFEECGNCPKNAETIFVETMHPTEIKFPIQTSKFKETINKMYQIHLDKNKDYSPANITIAGEIGVLIRIWDKFCRLCNLYGIQFPAVSPEIDKLIEIVNHNENLDKNYILTELQNLRKKSEFDFNNVEPKEAANEPIEDAWIDLSNYAIIGYLKRLNSWGR